MISGGCFCGAVRYETDAEPFQQTICHCSFCRRIVGAPTIAWFSVPRSSLSFVAGTPVSFQSSPGVLRRFCGTCGTSLTFEEDGHPDEVDVTICSLDAPELMPPKDHTQAASALSWDRVCDGLPAHAERRQGS